MSTPLLTINQLSAANTINGTELTPVYQNADTFRTDINSIVNFANNVITPPLSSATQILSSNVFTQINLRLPLAGGTMTGYITASAAPILPLHAATKGYVDGADALRVPLSGGLMTGFLSAQNPNTFAEVATKQYVDTLFAVSTAAAVELIRGAKASRFLYGFPFEGGAVSQGTRGKFFYLDGLNRLRMSGRDGQNSGTNNTYTGGGFGQAFASTYNSFINSVVPIQLETNEYAISAVGAGSSSFILTNRGNVYSTGINFSTPVGTSSGSSKGFLGIGNTTDNFVSTWQKIPTTSFGGSSAVQISICEAVYGNDRPRGQVAVVTNDGTAYAWGANDRNQISEASTNLLAVPTRLSGGSLGTNNVLQVLPVGLATFAIDSNNIVHVRGGSTGGYTRFLAQNTMSTTASNLVTFSACYFTPPGQSPTLGMRAQKLYVNGALGDGVLNYAASESFANYTLATTIALTAGKLWATGNNITGACAQGTTTSPISTFMPILSAANAQPGVTFVSVYPSWAGGILAIDSTGKTWGWGDRKSIGIPGSGLFTNYASIVPTLSDYNVKKIINASAQYSRFRDPRGDYFVFIGSAGSPVSIALTTDGRVFTTGSNKNGGNGQGTVTPDGAGSNTWIQVKLPPGVSAIDVGFSGDLRYRGTDDGDDDVSYGLMPSVHLLTTDSPDKILYDIYSFGSNEGFTLGLNQMTNAGVGSNTVSLPIKVSINL